MYRRSWKTVVLKKKSFVVFETAVIQSAEGFTWGILLSSCHFDFVWAEQQRDRKKVTVRKQTFVKKTVKIKKDILSVKFQSS